MRQLGILVSVILLSVGLAWGIAPGTDVLIAAAGGGSGAGGSQWVTSLQVGNSGIEATTVTAYWLVRGQANLTPQMVQFTLAAGETKEYADALGELFGLDSGGGAIRLVSDTPITANAAILNVAGGSEFGQGFAGVPAEYGVVPGQGAVVLGSKHGADHRTNLYLLDATGEGSTATVSAYDAAGVMTGSKIYELGAYMPVLESVTSLGVNEIEGGSLEISVSSGAVIGGASRVNSASGDPLTLEASTVTGARGFARCFPETLTGLHIRIVHPIPDGEDEIFEIEFTSETTANISDGPFTMPADVAVTSFGTGATVYAEIPGLNLSQITVSALCATETTGAFVGVGSTPFGPMTITGTGEIFQ